MLLLSYCLFDDFRFMDEIRWESFLWVFWRVGCFIICIIIDDRLMIDDEDEYMIGDGDYWMIF